MAWVAVSCPQCSAPLPRVALWRSVKCGSCGALITKTESLVRRDTFRQALLRARESSPHGDRLTCGGQSYHLLQKLGTGETSEVFHAQRLGPLPFAVVIKISTAAHAAAAHSREAATLEELHVLAGDAPDAFIAGWLPQVVSVGAVEDGSCHALVLKVPEGYWGNLADLHARFPQGIDPRHAVWLWRRLLAVLGFAHSRGWTHGDVRPEHALVHPADHGVRLIGWTSAEKNADQAAQAADLMRSARIIQVLLAGAAEFSSGRAGVPHELAALVEQAGQDAAFCQQQGAPGLDAALRTAGRAAFGPPAFVPLVL